MNRERLEYHLENWAHWMRSDREQLGYPRRSLMIATGGGSSVDEFEIMCDQADAQCAKQMDALIDSLKPPQKVAINHHWLQVKHCYPTQEYDLEMAYSALISLADRRGFA
jgi:hypothetical protein